MEKKRKAVIGYIILVFVLMPVASFFPLEAAALYLQVALIIMGVTAIVLQKWVHRGRFVDMGFRLNRDALAGLGVGLAYTIVMLALSYGLLLGLNLIEVTANRGSSMLDQGSSLTPAGLTSLVVSGILMFVLALFTEELAWRGYILPKLENLLGGLKAVIVSSILFGLWHIPVYYSIYAGGAEEQGWLAVAKSAMLGSGLAVVPLCILYLTTRELYGVSLSHALFDLFAYHIVGQSALGEMAKNALYSVRVLNESASQTLDWILPVLGIPIMLALCALAKRFVGSRSLRAGSLRPHDLHRSSPVA